MTTKNGAEILPAQGQLGVLLPGLGAVSTTVIAGVEAVRRGRAKPIGSLTQMGTIRLGEGSDSRTSRLTELVSLSALDDLVFGAWDIFPDNAYQVAKRSRVLSREDLEQARPFLETIEPMPGVFDPAYVRRLHGMFIKSGSSKMDLAQQLIADIEQFKKTTGVSRCVAVWCGSTEVYQKPSASHSSLAELEKGLLRSDENIAPSVIYAYACLRAGVPYANGAPNLSLDFPAMAELSTQTAMPIAGKDFKTGQTLMKTILAPGLKARCLGLQGWFSTNILGNRDGEVLDDPEAFKTKEMSKLGALEHILQPQLQPDLYKDFCHLVRINYYPPRGDDKEGWDNIDIFGWMGYPMQIKVDFLCRDSILAAPIVLDLALFLDLAQRAGMSGIQEWLSFYFKSPMTAPDRSPEHDLFIQLMKLTSMLRELRGEETVTDPGAATP
jgi:myo-inositol-1-phosphate synthase